MKALFFLFVATIVLNGLAYADLKEGMNKISYQVEDDQYGEYFFDISFTNGKSYEDTETAKALSEVLSDIIGLEGVNSKGFFGLKSSTERRKLYKHIEKIVGTDDEDHAFFCELLRERKNFNCAQKVNAMLKTLIMEGADSIQVYELFGDEYGMFSSIFIHVVDHGAHDAVTMHLDVIHEI
jgi:hypothetical protein